MASSSPWMGRCSSKYKNLPSPPASIHPFYLGKSGDCLSHVGFLEIGIQVSLCVCVCVCDYLVLTGGYDTCVGGREGGIREGCNRKTIARSRSSAHGKDHEEGGSAYAKAGSSLGSPPGNSRASTPKTRVCILYCFVLSPTPLTLRGLSPTTSL